MKKIKKLFVSEKFVLSITIVVAVFSFAYIVYADSVSTQVDVGNAVPSVSATSFNNASAITLVENTTKVIYATSTVSDANGCDTIASVMADFYRSDRTNTNCDAAGEANNNYCYPEVVCTVEAGTCTGGADTSANYVCAVTLQFYADPTDGAAPNAASTWEVTVEAGDGTASSTEAANVELNSLLSLDVTSSMNYGTLAANTNTGNVNSTTTVTNTGNRDMDPELSGTVLTSGGDTIAIANQEYGQVFTYGGGTALSASATGFNIALPLPHSTTTPVTDDISWGIAIDNGQPSGTYTGTNTVGAAAGL